MHYRRKGGSAEVGASAPGQIGPFGLRPYALVPDAGDTPSPWLALANWLDRAGAEHPLWDWERHQSEPGVRAGLDSLEAILAAADTTLGPVDGTRLRGKRRDFAALRTHRQLLDLRAELAVGAALGAAGLFPLLGDTKVSNPDFLVTLPSGGPAGVEVTAPSPPGVNDLCDRIEDEVLTDFPGVDAALAFSRYPSRIQQPAADTVLTAVRTLATAPAAPVDIELPYDRMNGAEGLDPLSVRVEALPGSGSTTWQVTAGELTPALDSAAFAAFASGSTAAKAAQGRSLTGAPVVLAADMSRYGAAWMRPGPTWAQKLAASEHFTPEYPFAAVAVFKQSLTEPGVIDPGVGINPHVTGALRAAVEELCRAAGWPAS